MKIMIPFVMAMAATPGVEAWSLGPSNWPAPMLLDTHLDTDNTPATFGGILKRQRELANRMLEETDRLIQETTGSAFPNSLRYELIDNDEKFQVSLDVPGVKPEDMSINVENDGFVTIRGERLATTENSRFASKFSQTFSLDPSVDVESFNANLDNGVLVITAAKDKSKIEDKVRKIPISAGMTVNKALHTSATEPVVEEAGKTGGHKVDVVSSKEEKAKEVINLDHEPVKV